jgi:CHAT domain-containing protein/Flp pilus assembly protein TadD
MRAKLPEGKNILKGFAVFSHNNMERAEKEGEENLEQREAIKDYLLGTSSDKAKMREIEEKILLDDNFEETLTVAEDELIDKYLDDSLTEPERERFTRFFLNAPERKEKLRLIRSIKEYAAKSETQSVKQFSKQKSGFFDWRKLISLPSFRLAAAALLVLLFGFIVWRAVFYQSDVDKGLALVRIGIAGQRRTEARTTINPNYAPLTVTRGDNEAARDEKALRRGANILSEAADDTKDAEAQYALGLAYLADKNFEDALEKFNAALKLSPRNAKLLSDIGAVYLEKARLAEADGKYDEFNKNLDLSLQHIDKALQLDEGLTEALFNKALLYQKRGLTSQAAEAWNKYLENDSTSPWADEARRQLQKLDSQKSRNLSPEALEKAFLNAFRQKNETEAKELISQNREIITEKYLPQRLTMSLVAASDDEKKEYLEALTYAGELEKKYTGDSFAADLALFYKNVPKTNLELLKNALALTREGYKLCANGQIEEALKKFESARELFLQAGNVWEAKLNEVFIAYFYITGHRYKESLKLAEEIVDFCRQKNYKWLLSNTLLWRGTAQRRVGQRTSAESSYSESLDLAEEIKDSFMLQSINLELAKLRKFVGQDKEALSYLHRAFTNGDMPGASLRQKWRNYSDGVEILANAGCQYLAKAVSLENLRLAEELNPVLYNYSQLEAGIAYSRAGDYEEAKKWFVLAEKTAESIGSESYLKDVLAKSSLELGHLERKLGNFSQASDFYVKSLGFDKDSEYYRYEIQKSRLLAQIPLGNDAEIEKQIVETIELAEKYREQIAEDQQRDTFFDNEQTVYDIAVANNFEHGRYEQAYNYLETSSSRSLLDWLKKGVDIDEEKKKIEEITLREHTQPLQLAEIRAQMPERVQILQFAVLENKVLIWLVSKDDFKVVASEINSETLNEKVASYVRLVSVENPQKQEEVKALSRELYDLLLSPIIAELDPTREICLIPHKILFHLPFAALTAPDGNPFLAQFSFTSAPSANVFLLFTANARQKTALTDEFLLSVGNPRFEREEFKKLENLPEAEYEATAIREFYPKSEPIIGARATETALQNFLRNAEVINIAGHYIVRHGEPLASGLLLTKTGDSDSSKDGIFTNAELIKLKLPRAKLVVLSACQTGIEQYYKGEGLVGLSRTFLAAGAPLVVASQWKVDSGAAAQLIINFHRFRRREKLSTAAALRRAQLEMLESSDERLRQPYFWAAFATYGGYAEF